MPAATLTILRSVSCRSSGERVVSIVLLSCEVLEDERLHRLVGTQGDCVNRKLQALVSQFLRLWSAGLVVDDHVAVDVFVHPVDASPSPWSRRFRKRSGAPAGRRFRTACGRGDCRKSFNCCDPSRSYNSRCTGSSIFALPKLIEEVVHHVFNAHWAPLADGIEVRLQCQVHGRAKLHIRARLLGKVPFEAQLVAQRAALITVDRAGTQRPMHRLRQAAEDPSTPRSATSAARPHGSWESLRHSGSGRTRRSP